MEHINQLWDQTLNIIKDEMNPVSFDTWFKPLEPITIEDNIFIIRAENDFFKNTVEQRYKPLIQNALNHVTTKDYVVKIISKTDSIDIKPKKSNADVIENLSLSNLNPRYVFSSFVVGNSNRMAHAASLAVAEAPARAYNPLFLYGDAGLGKTHLMHSIAHYILEQNPNAKVLYVTSETFTNELIDSIKNNRNVEFRNKYRNIDVLLIDDIQFISKKEGTQEEFFHTFNALHNSDKQIIISSDKPPKEIGNLESRLRSRFEMGLIADIQSPDYETRLAILRKKADTEGIVVSDEIMTYIASSIASNIRELEGALTRVVAFSKLISEDITLELAENALKDIFGKEKTINLNPEYIQEVVCNFYNIKIEDIKGSKKPKNIAYPRQIAMYLSRKLLDLSLPKIGEHFGGRDHTTVIHACSKIERELENNIELQKNILELEKRIKGQWLLISMFRLC